MAVEYADGRTRPVRPPAWMIRGQARLNALRRQWEEAKQDAADRAQRRLNTFSTRSGQRHRWQPRRPR